MEHRFTRNHGRNSAKMCVACGVLNVHKDFLPDCIPARRAIGWELDLEIVAARKIKPLDYIEATKIREELGWMVTI